MLAGAVSYTTQRVTHAYHTLLQAFLPRSSCAQAVFLLNTAMSLEDLNMTPVPVITPSMPEFNLLGNLRWADINNFLANKMDYFARMKALMDDPFRIHYSTFFSYAKPMPCPEIDETSTASDVFRMTAGVFAISVSIYHEEDMGIEGAEPIGHYVAYNAGTRALFLYPEVQLAHACTPM